MPLHLEIRKKFLTRSDRVKCIDFHPTEPWILVGLYIGSVYIYNYETQTLIKEFEVSEHPVRAVRFIARKNWFVCGSDDMHIRAFNYNTHEKITDFEAHNDYIRNLAVHPNKSFVLSSSDDMLIKLWDWDKSWKNAVVFEGHSHYVMQIVFNPKDPNTFASASLDRTIKVWNLASSTANYTLEGHERGVNCVEYYHGGDRPYLISGADDRHVKIWDYQNKTCVQTLEGHLHNVSVVCFHPDLPIILTGSEDGTVKIWHSSTYRLENTLNYGMERVWAMAYMRGSNDIAIGYDHGSVVIKLGREEPVISMDNGGKIIWAKHNLIMSSNVKTVSEEDIKDGERLSLPVKELGSCELYPQSLLHNPNGRFVVVCGDGEYIIYTALAWRNKAFGSAMEFAWSGDSNRYAIRETVSCIKIFKDFKETLSIRPNYNIEGIYGGTLLGLRSSSFLCFYDWETATIVRRIDIVPSTIYWSASGELVTITSENVFYVLRFDEHAFNSFLNQSSLIPEEGIEDTFQALSEVQEDVKTGLWVGDCFLYTNTANRLNYYVGGQVYTMAHFDRTMYLLSYIARDNRAYLTDKDLAITSQYVSLAVLEYQTAVLHGDLQASESILPTIPLDQRSRVARFLESQNMKEQAFDISTDSEHKFELAMQLQRIDMAYQLATEADSELKWNQLAVLALSTWDLTLAEKCMQRANDQQGLFLLYSSINNVSGMKKLLEQCIEDEKNNLAFLAAFSLAQSDQCVELLLANQRFPEAAFFARSYAPSLIPRAIKEWKTQLETSTTSSQRKLASTLANPVDHPQLFPEYEESLMVEKQRRKLHQVSFPSSAFVRYKENPSQFWDTLMENLSIEPDPSPVSAFANGKDAMNSFVVTNTSSNSITCTTDSSPISPLPTHDEDFPPHNVPPAFITDPGMKTIPDQFEVPSPLFGTDPFQPVHPIHNDENDEFPQFQFSVDEYPKVTSSPHTVLPYIDSQPSVSAMTDDEYPPMSLHVHQERENEKDSQNFFQYTDEEVNEEVEGFLDV